MAYDLSAWANLAALFTGTVASAGEAFTQSRALREQARFERQRSLQNARLADLQAQDATRRGDETSRVINERTARLIGRQRAALAAQGQDLDEGDALAIQEETAQLGELDALTARMNAFREAWGYGIQADQYRSDARTIRRAGRTAARNTLLSGGLRVARDVAQGVYSFRRDEDLRRFLQSNTDPKFDTSFEPHG